MEKEKKVLEALTCPNCNGEVELDKNQEFGFCKYCGTKLQNTAIKKINAKVKIDTEDEIKKLYILARRAKDNDDAEKAEKYYSRILNEVPNDWEAQFFSTYFSCKQTTIANMGSSCMKLGKTLKSVFSLIKTSDLSETEKIEVYKIIDYNTLNYYLLILNNVLTKANTYIDTCDSTFVTNFLTEHFQGITFLLLTLGDELNKVNLKEEALRAYKSTETTFSYISPETVNAIVERIKSIDPTYTYTPKVQNQKNGCYVATAVYGSYDCKEVWTLRRFRDYYLDERFFGRLFIKVYYAVSPTMVKLFGKNKHFISFNKRILDKFVNKLNAQGYENTKYNDKY